MIYLRPWKLEDAEALYKLSTDSFLQRQWDHRYLYPNTIEDAKKCICFYRNADIKRFLIRAIFYNSQLCGFIQCEVKDHEKGEISYYLGSEYQHHGIMKTSISLFSDSCFHSLPITILLARVEKKNIASQHVLERNGFKKCYSSTTMLLYDYHK